jgi:uncharacterized membrane protein YkoI
MIGELFSIQSTNKTIYLMKMSRHLVVATTSLTFLLGITSLSLGAKQETASLKGSIRPERALTAPDLPALAKISMATALMRALAKAPGDAIKAELEVEDGNLMYSFEIVGSDKTITEVEIDAGDGRVLNVDHETSAK